MYKYILIILIFLSGCAVYKPDSKSISEPDYNQRVEVEDAHFDRVLTPVGYTSIAAGTVIGGYTGYVLSKDNDLFSNYKNGTKQNSAIVGGLMGAFTGFTISYLMNRAFGWGDVRPPTDPQEWIKAANNDYYLIRKNDNSNFMLIHKNAEANYISKNLIDAKDFSVAFPNSKYEDKVVLQTGEILPRNELPSLINLFPNNRHNEYIKLRYLNLSTNLDECIEAKNRYPSIDTAAETKCLTFIKSFNDIDIFEKNWPNSRYRNKIGYMFLSFCSNIDECNIARKRYPFLSNDAEPRAFNFVKTCDDIFLFNRYWPNSIYNDQLIEKSMTLCSRNRLPSVIRLFNNNSNIENLKIYYISQSKTYKEFVDNVINMNCSQIVVNPSLDIYDDKSVQKELNNILSYSNILGYDNALRIYNNLDSLYKNRVDSLFVLAFEDYVDNAFNFLYNYPKIKKLVLILRSRRGVNIPSDFFDKFTKIEELIIYIVGPTLHISNQINKLNSLKSMYLGGDNGVIFDNNIYLPSLKRLLIYLYNDNFTPSFFPNLEVLILNNTTKNLSLNLNGLKKLKYFKNYGSLHSLDISKLSGLSEVYVNGDIEQILCNHKIKQKVILDDIMIIQKLKNSKCECDLYLKEFQILKNLYELNYGKYINNGYNIRKLYIVNLKNDFELIK